MEKNKQTTTEPHRININGIWYVRESEIIDLTDYRKEVENSSVCAQSFTFECDDYCWEATRIIKDNGDYYDDIDIEFTDKTIKPFLEELWDHNQWMVGVYQNNPDSMIEAKIS